ncbi:MAG: hypothetical protein IJQ58_02185 [Synergistaceae bacterium]|nr:hypothetical protein [Synergistaceae bacterium]
MLKNYDASALVVNNGEINGDLIIQDLTINIYIGSAGDNLGDIVINHGEVNGDIVIQDSQVNLYVDGVKKTITLEPAMTLRKVINLPLSE